MQADFNLYCDLILLSNQAILIQDS